MKRTIALLVEPEKFDFFEEEMPEPGPGELLVKTLFTGLCHSDLPVYFGTGCTNTNANGYHFMDPHIPYPFGVGHEPTGVVAAVGPDVTAFRPGDVVSGMVHGTFATHFMTTEQAILKIDRKPGTYPLAEPLMCIANIAQIAAPEFGDRVAVIGCGYMGLMTIMALAGGNLRELVAVDVRDDRLEMARRMGATVTINPKKEDLEDASFNITEGLMYDVVIEITGSLRGLDTALRIIRLADRFGPKGRGKILLPSLYGKAEQWDPNTGYNLMLRGPILHSAHPRYCMDLKDSMRRGMDMYRKGVLRHDELISHKFELKDIAEAFSVLAGGDETYMKGVVVFPE